MRSCNRSLRSASRGTGTPGNPFSPPVHRASENSPKIAQLADRKVDHREKDPNTVPRQDADNNAEGCRSDESRRYGQPAIAQITARQEIRGSEASAAMEGGVAKRQEVKSKPENSPDQDAREEIDPWCHCSRYCRP